VISYGDAQFSPTAPPTEKPLFFSIQYAVANIGAFIGYAAFPYVSIHGVGAIPADYGYCTVYIIGFIMVLLFLVTMWGSRERYMNVPPTRKSIALVIWIVPNHAKTNFATQMIVFGMIHFSSNRRLLKTLRASADSGRIFILGGGRLKGR